MAQHNNTEGELFVERTGYGDFIAKRVAAIPHEQLFPTQVIAETMAEAYAIPIRQAKKITNVNLKRLADKGELERFQKGVYYRAKQTVFGKVRPTVSALVVQVLTRRGDRVIGYETGASLVNKLGLTTLVPRKREIATNAYRKKLNDTSVVVKKPVAVVDRDNYRYFQLLDTIRDLPQMPIDAENPIALLRAFVEKNKIDLTRALTYARKYYSQKTVLGVVDLLVER